MSVDSVHLEAEGGQIGLEQVTACSKPRIRCKKQKANFRYQAEDSWFYLDRHDRFCCVELSLSVLLFEDSNSTEYFPNELIARLCHESQ
jgi:hypothetical protein